MGEPIQTNKEMADLNLRLILAFQKVCAAVDADSVEHVLDGVREARQVLREIDSKFGDLEKELADELEQGHD